MAKIIDIQQVPPSPNTSTSPTSVYNPTDSDFTFYWNSQPFVIPAKGVLIEAEYIARHGAKHLAKKIVSAYHEFKIKKDAVGQITPDTAKAIPLIEVQTMMEALLMGESAFESFGVPILEVKVGKPTEKAEEVKIEEQSKIEEIKKEEIPEQPKIEEVNPLKCKICGFVAKSKAGLSVHIRFKHRQ